ncbi:MAG: hypothetical protein K8S94_06615 [Planctomycetia bacterium]|nr:hypothetical protein [Planctomycetia bacterium]
MVASSDPEFVSCLAAAAVATAAAVAVFLVRGSTAVPAALWAVAAALVFSLDMAARAAGWLVDPAAIAATRLVVVALSLCPTMAILGAKRPQHGVWQFIVGSLAGVLVMPALSATLVRPGSMPDVHPVQRWFMPLLVVVGWMNFAATRHGVAAAAVAAGQCLLLRPFLPFVEPGGIMAMRVTDAVGACLVALGAVLAAAQSIGWPVGVRGRLSALQAQPALLTREIDLPFLALRETLGAAWALRIAERFNVVAEARGWPCRLRFAGLEAAGDPDDHSWHRDAIRGARALLHRFVSDAWLRRHVSRGFSPGEYGSRVAPPEEGK